MTRYVSIDALKEALCQHDEDYEYPCITPSYLEQELEQLAVDDVPTTKNNLGVDCINRATVLHLINDVKNSDGFKDYSQYEYLFDQVDMMPSVTPQLSVPEVTALAEWTEKLTKASVDAYNMGYADGMKAQEPIIDKIRAEIERQREKVSEKHSDNEELQVYYNGLNDGLKDARDICDKYRVESE